MGWLRQARWGALLVGLASALSQRVASADAFTLPAQAASLNGFVPSGWSIEEKLEGDLDGDTKSDVALVLAQDEREGSSERQLGLVVVLRREPGWVRAGMNTQFLVCLGCGGVVGGAPDLKLERGALVVRQYVGSRERSASTLRLRWSRERGYFELIGVDSEDYDAATGESSRTSCNWLTGDCIGTDTPRQVDDDGNELRVKPKPKIKRWRSRRRALPRLEDLANPFD